MFLRISAPLGTPIERTEAIARGLERQLPLIIGDDLDGITARIGHQDARGASRERGVAEHEAVVSVFLKNEPSYSAHAWIARVKQELAVPDGVALV